jgi:hypothetical protein
VPSLAGFRDCRRALVDGGIDPADAAWMMAYRIKTAVHARYWGQHQREGNQARLPSLKANPDAAVGGRHNFDAEMHSLRVQIERSTQRLSELAVNHVLILLCAENPDARLARLLFKLTTRTVLQMSYCADGEELRRQWAAAEELPAFARALTLWASPALVEENKALAAELFRRTAELPLSRGARGLQVSRMITLLDLAVSACTEAGRQDFVRDLVELWAEAYRDWQPLFPQWANAAETMAAAVERGGSERTTFLADPSFAQTHCRRLIEARAGVD